MSLVSFFQNIEAQTVAWVKNEYANVIRPLIEKEAAAFKPLVRATEQEIIQLGLPIVLSFFGSSGAALTGAEKMGSAVSQLISQLGAMGKTIAVSDAQAGLQIIVGQVKDAAAGAQAALAHP
jgi:hypothetical protein